MNKRCIAAVTLCAKWKFHQIWITMKHCLWNGSHDFCLCMAGIWGVNKIHIYIYIYTYINIYISFSLDLWTQCIGTVSMEYGRTKYIEWHYSDVIISAMASQITSLTIIYSAVCSGADQRKHQSSVSLVFVRGIHRWPVNSPHKGPVTRKIFPFDDVIMKRAIWKGKKLENLRTYTQQKYIHEKTIFPATTNLQIKWFWNCETDIKEVVV